jgi:hypothetical protein
LPSTPPKAQLKIFKDVVLCATGIKNKARVTSVVVDLSDIGRSARFSTW